MLTKSALAVAILFANFPVAISFILIAEHRISESTARIENRSGFPVEDFRLVERDITYRLGEIPPGESIRRTFHFRYEGAVNYSFVHRGQMRSGILFGYVTSGIGVTSTLVIDESGALQRKEQI